MENINKEKIFERIQEIIYDKVGNNLSEVKLESNLTTDFGLDSLDEVELCMEIELTYSINIDNLVWSEWKIVENVVNDVFKIINE